MFEKDSEARKEAMRASRKLMRKYLRGDEKLTGCLMPD